MDSEDDVSDRSST